MTNNLPDLPTVEYPSPTPPQSGHIAFTYPERDLYDIANREGVTAHVVTSAELAGMSE